MIATAVDTGNAGPVRARVNASLRHRRSTSRPFSTIQPSCVRPSAYQVRAVTDPPLRTRLCLATSSMRRATLTQQTTLAIIRQAMAGLG